VSLVLGAAVERRRNSVRMKVGMSIALLATLLAAGATPAFAATPTSGSGDKSAGTTTHTSKFAISQAECAAVHQQYPNAECAIVVKTTDTAIKVAADKPTAGSISPAVLINGSYCSSHNYFAGTRNLQMIMNGVWSYTMWVQYEGDKACGAVQYQIARCYQDWGILWTASTNACNAAPAGLMVWRWWGDPSYAYADYTMTYSIPVVGGVSSFGHHGWVQVNGQTGAVSSSWN
jgi:hypothetical protein